MKKYFILFVLLTIQNSALAQSSALTQDSIAKIISRSFILSSEGNVEEAFELQNFALEWAEKNNNDSIRGEAYHCMGVVYSILEENDKAKLYYSKSLEALKKANYTSYMVYHHNNMAVMYAREGDSITAISQYKIARTIALDNNLSFNAYWPTFNLAVYYFKIKNYALSTSFFNEVIHLFQPNTEHQPFIVPQSYNYLARINHIKGETESALKNLEAAHKFGLEIESYPELIETEKVRFDIYNTKNETKAKAALLRQIGYQEENLKITTKQTKINAKLKQDLLKNEKELENAKRTNAEKITTLIKTRYFTYAIALLLLITFIITFLLFKSNKTRDALNKSLVLKNALLTEAKEKSDYASKLKDNFFSTISHELRTPLYAVTGITDILIEEEPKVEQIHYLATLKSSGEYLLALINNVLQINKFDADKIELNTLDFNLKNIVSNITNSLSYLKKENNNVIHVAIDQHVPLQLKGDSLKLTQILINLLSNALKFTQDGNIWLTIDLINRLNNKVTIKFSIKDDGIGVSENIKAKIFEDFYQESMHLERNYEGTGLGLAIVKRLLKVMGSTIKVESKQNEGSTFCFTIMLEEVLSCPINRNLKTTEFTNFSTKHILVVDDNSVNQMITKRILENKNAKVTVVGSGLDAIQKTQEQHFDVILMDIHMPHMNGYTTTQNIRQFNSTIPIIALTAVKLDENKEKIFSSGMNGVIVKPFRLEDFFSELSKFMMHPS